MVVTMVDRVPETDDEFRAVGEDCDDASADGLDVNPENFDECGAVVSPDLAVLTEDCEEASCKRLGVWLEDSDEEYTPYPAEPRLSIDDCEETENDRLEVEYL